MWPKMTKGDNQLLNIRLARLNLRILVQLLPALKWHLRYFHCSLPYLKETCMFLDLGLREVTAALLLKLQASSARPFHQIIVIEYIRSHLHYIQWIVAGSTLLNLDAISSSGTTSPVNGRLKC